MKGTTTTVQIGPLSIEAILTEDGNYYVAAKQVASVFGSRQDHASRDLKAILGEGLVLAKISVKSEADGVRQNTCIALSDFERVLRHYDRKGNPQAQSITDSMIGLSLTQLFSDAFGVKFEAADRQAFLKARAEGIAVRRSLTDAVQEYYIRTTGDKPEGHVYASLTNHIYIALFRKTAAEMKAERGLVKGHALRDTLTTRELRSVENLEDCMVRKIDRGTDPFTALIQML